MDRVRAIIKDDEFHAHLDRIKLAEAERIYCKHDYHHALSVARLAYLICLEIGQAELNKEVIYAAGLLHDIGRWVEYSTGEDHCFAGAKLAEPILKRYSFNQTEIAEITEGIRQHRHPNSSELGKSLAQADDLSRDCYRCQALETCYKAVSMQKLQQDLIL